MLFDRKLLLLLLTTAGAFYFCENEKFARFPELCFERTRRKPAGERRQTDVIIRLVVAFAIIVCLQNLKLQNNIKV